MAARHCCKQMSSAIATDELVAYDGRAYAYGLIGARRKAEPTSMRFCPWCGSLLFRASRAKPSATPEKPARRAPKKKQR
jgi:hypothetical protein